MKRLFDIPAYRRLLLAYGLNELAWWVGTLALAVLVYQRTGSALGSAAFFLCSQIAPAVLSPVLVSRIDQLDMRRVLPVLYLIEGVLFAVLAWMTHRFVLPIVLILVLLDGSVALVARSLGRSATTELLRPVDLLHEGNALTNLVFSGSYMAGPIIGGLVVASGGTVAALLVNCVLFVAVALVLATAAGLPGAAPEPDPVKHRLRAAVRHVRENRPLRTVLSLQLVGMVVFTISMPVEVVLAEHTLHAGAGGFGALMAGWGAGAVLGSAAYARWRRKPGRLLITSSAVALGLGFVLMAAAPTIIVAVIGGLIAGTGNGGGLMATKTIVQEYTPQRWMALITSFSEAGAQTAPGLGIIIGGVVTALSTARVSLGLAAGGSLIYAAVAWALLGPSSLPPPPESPERESPASQIRPMEMESRGTLA
jgi:MFS family permease